MMGMTQSRSHKHVSRAVEGNQGPSIPFYERRLWTRSPVWRLLYPLAVLSPLPFSIPRTLLGTKGDPRVKGEVPCLVSVSCQIKQA